MSLVMSAANSHHLVSEPSALDPVMNQKVLNVDQTIPGLFMFTLQNDPLEGDFDPSLPPIFDIYADDILFNLYNPCFHKQGEPLKITKEEERHAQWVTIEVGNVFPTHGGTKTTNPCYVEIGCSSRTVWVFKEIGPDGIRVQGCGDDSLESIRALHTFGQGKIVFRTHHGVLKRNYGYIKLVFDPGIDQRMMAIYEQPISALKAQESGRFFLKKGSMISIRVGSRDNEGTSSLKVGNQFNYSRE